MKKQFLLISCLLFFGYHASGLSANRAPSRDVSNVLPQCILCSKLDALRAQFMTYNVRENQDSAQSPAANLADGEYTDLVTRAYEDIQRSPQKLGEFDSFVGLVAAGDPFAGESIGADTLSQLIYHSKDLMKAYKSLLPLLDECRAADLDNMVQEHLCHIRTSNDNLSCVKPKETLADCLKKKHRLK